MSYELVVKELKNYSSAERKKANEWFFKTGPGEYGEGDKFLGVAMPDLRKVAKKYYSQMTDYEITPFLKSEFHEIRLLGIIMWTYQYEKTKEEADRISILDFYMNAAHLGQVNNWDLVDSSAHKILGRHLWEYSDNIDYLRELAEDDDLWLNRIAIIATAYFIGKDEFQPTLEISEKLINHQHDLIHKAVGWMLREVGKKDQKIEEQFLKKYYKKMPRTMLRYAIEKFPEDLRKQYLRSEI